jgi:hypothetical protein
MTQVDHGLTNVSGFDPVCSVISTNDANSKHGASQPTPLKQNLIPRFVNKIRAIPSDMPGVTREKDISDYTFRY